MSEEADSTDPESSEPASVFSPVSIDAFSLSKPAGGRQRLAEALVELRGFPEWAAQTAAERVLDPDTLRKRMRAEASYAALPRDPRRGPYRPDYRIGVYQVWQTPVMLPLVLPSPIPFRFAGLVPPPIAGGDQFGYREEGDGPTLRFRFSGPDALAAALTAARQRYVNEWKPLRKEINRYGLLHGSDDIRLAVAEIVFADGSEPVRSLVSLNGSARLHLVQHLLGLDVDTLLRLSGARRQAAGELGHLRKRALDARASLDPEGLRRQELLHIHYADLIVGFDASRHDGLLAAARGAEMHAHTDWQARYRPGAEGEEDDA